MEVEKRISVGEGHSIEFGKATWDKRSVSIRNRYTTANGGFSPRSSSELPIEDISLLLLASVENGYIEGPRLIEIAEVCLKKLKSDVTQTKGLTREDKLKLMQEAATDKLFLADVDAAIEDFRFTDNEN